MDKLKILYIGTGEFAVPVLKSLLENPFVEVVGVITQPDKPIGREQRLAGGPVKQYLQTLERIPFTFQPEKLRLESQEILSETKPDLVVVAAYGQMIPDDILNEPSLGAINLHGSLLPKLRGAVPIPMAIWQGLQKTGVTILKVVPALDAGPIYAMQEVDILPTDTTETLKNRLADIGVEMLNELLPKLVAGEIEPIEQKEAEATYCYATDIAKEKAEITFDTPVLTAERMVRAFQPWPVAWFSYAVEGEMKRIKIFASKVFEEGIALDSTELEIVRYGKKLLLVLADGALELMDIQMESKNRRPTSDYFFLAKKTVAPTLVMPS
jgi:methionyl-tRNA formyltransferase